MYYSEAQKCESDERVDTITESQPQPPDITCVAPSDYVPMVQVFEMEPYTQAHWYPLETVCQTFRGQGMFLGFLAASIHLFGVTPGNKFDYIYIFREILGPRNSSRWLSRYKG